MYYTCVPESTKEGYCTLPSRSHAVLRSPWGPKSCIMPLLVILAAAQVTIVTVAQTGAEAQHHAEEGLRYAQTGDLKKAESEFRSAVELSPRNPDYLSYLGRVLAIERQLDKASAYFEKALQLDPNNLAIRRDLAANQWELGHLKEAKKNLERVLRSKPGDEPAILLLGMVAENSGDYAAAARWLGSVPALVKQRAESVAALAHAYYRIGQKEKAQETLRTLPDQAAQPQGVFLGGQVALEEGDYETAERLFASIRATFPDRAKLGTSLAQAQFRSNRFRACQDTLLEVIGAGHETSEIYNLLAWCYYKQEKFQETVRAFDQAIDLDPTNESNYLDLGKTLIEHHLYGVALAVAQKSIEQVPSSYRAWMMKGMVEAKQARYTEAIKSYARAVELNPGSAEANFNLAKVQGLAGMTKEAAATFEQGIRRFPGDSAHYVEYAQMLLKLAETGDAAAERRAIDKLNAALAIDGSLSEPHYQLGNLALREGHAHQALKHLEAAERLNPQDSRIHYALARAYRRLGLERKAAEELEAYEKIKPEEETPSLTSSLPEAKKR